MTTPAAPTPNQMPGAQPAATTPPPPATDQAAAGQHQAPAAPQAPPAGEQQPPWGDAANFDPQRAWNLIQNVRTENDGLKGKLADAQPILDAHEQQRRDSQTELDTAREDLTKVATSRDDWRGEALRSKAEAIAATARFQDPADAVSLLGDLSTYADGTTVDAAKLTERINKLAADKPYLLGTPPPAGFTPNRGQGQSGNGPLAPAQVAAHADSQQDWKAAGNAKANQLRDLHQKI